MRMSTRIAVACIALIAGLTLSSGPAYAVSYTSWRGVQAGPIQPQRLQGLVSDTGVQYCTSATSCSSNGPGASSHAVLSVNGPAVWPATGYSGTQRITVEYFFYGAIGGCTRTSTGLYCQSSWSLIGSTSSSCTLNSSQYCPFAGARDDLGGWSTTSGYIYTLVTRVTWKTTGGTTLGQTSLAYGTSNDYASSPYTFLQQGPGNLLGLVFRTQ